MAKRVLVTGGRGFIGSALTTALRLRGDLVFLLDMEDGDVRHEGDVYTAWKQAKPDVVYHLAARTEVRQSFHEPHETIRTNVLGTLNVLEAARLFGVGKLVVASTDKAYGAGRAPSVEHHHLYGGGDVYSVSKQLADELAGNFANVYKLPLVTTRFVNVYGPGQHNATTLITNSIVRVLKDEKPIVHFDLAQREWLFIDDAVKAYLLLGDAEFERPSRYGPGCYAWNVGGQRCNVKGVVKSILHLMRKPIDWYEETESALPQLLCNHVDDAKFIAKFPDWKPIPLPIGLERTIAWHRESV